MFVNIAGLSFQLFTRTQNVVPEIVSQADTENCTPKESRQYKNEAIRKEKVYNLLVDQDNVYYANGVLVGNCDALVYLVMGMIKKRVFKKVERPDKI